MRSRNQYSHLEFKSDKLFGTCASTFSLEEGEACWRGRVREGYFDRERYFDKEGYFERETEGYFEREREREKGLL